MSNTDHKIGEQQIILKNFYIVKLICLEDYYPDVAHSEY